MEFLRGVLGLIGVLCAFMLGRTAAFVRKGQLKPTRLYAWVIRCFLCLGAMTIRHAVDITDIATWTLAAAVCAIAFWEASRQKKEEPVHLDLDTEGE